jgi:hypothetical protein
MLYEFDRSPELSLALVADAAGRSPHYVALSATPSGHRVTDAVTLRQMHAVANGVVDGLIVRPRLRWEPGRWDHARAGK